MVNTYASKDSVTLETLAEDPPQFLENILASCARNKSEKKSYEAKGQPNMFRSMSIKDSLAEYGYIYYENNSEGATLVETTKFD